MLDDIDINKLVDEVYDDKDLLKLRKKGIYLSDNDIDIFKKYGIDYNKYRSIGELIFDIESILNEESNLDDLEKLSSKLAELNYYNNTNK